MSLIELALQRVKADSAKGTAEKSNVGAGVPAAGGVPLRNDPVPAVAAEPREPEIFITEAFLREKGLLAPETHEHQQRAEYRHIKYGLLREISRQGGHGLILVTSALQGEGKSFSAVHLALSLASEQDYTVVLVDADVIRPSVSRLMGCEDRPGLMNALVDGAANLESLILPTNVRGLSFLPSGRHEERATEFFSSARMAEIARQLLSVPNRIVVVDTLPLLLTTESRALASLGGQIVMVVRAESTPQNAVMEAIDLLGEGANVKLLLNAAVRSKALEYYGLGQGYDYTTNTKKEKTP
jgi:receptor protein-tyrosine kinase